MQGEFTGKTALVTGASRGIGAATAVALAQAGVSRILLHYNSSREGAEAAAELVRKHGSEAELLQGELSSEDGIDQLCRELAGRDIDILINNAGHLVGRANLPDFTPALYDQVMNLNVRSLYFITQAGARSMLAKGSGVIVNVTSIAARHGGGPGATIYAAAKSAVSAITKGVAKELAPKGIRVNAVSPGTVDNDFHAKYSTRQMLDSMLAATPAGKLGTNEEVADVILFLCSDASRYMYGQTLEINGGMYMV